MWIPEPYVLHHRIVSVDGYVKVNSRLYSAPYQLIGKRMEVRETKEKIVIYDGPRIVGEHDEGARLSSGGGAGSDDRKGPDQSSEITPAPADPKGIVCLPIDRRLQSSRQEGGHGFGSEVV